MKPQIAQIDADLRDPQTHAIIGAAMEVHRELGPGFLEAVYHDEAQVINYLRATRLERSLLFNFGRPSLEFKRLIVSKSA
ncbi:MAG: hypothetical protein FJ280_23935 [Planctomycetes bacterium]|nr:hypothetical protein [Planctomycetota bacterium]